MRFSRVHAGEAIGRGFSVRQFAEAMDSDPAGRVDEQVVRLADGREYPLVGWRCPNCNQLAADVATSQDAVVRCAHCGHEV